MARGSKALPPSVQLPSPSGEDMATRESFKDYLRRHVRAWKEAFALDAYERELRTAGDVDQVGDRILPSSARAQHDPVEILPNAIADEQGNPGQPYRAVDSLERMFKGGTITGAMYAAGTDFRNDFRLAQHDPMRAVELGRIPGNGKASSVAMEVARARDRVWEALVALGGQGTPVGSCAWFVLGCEMSVAEWARRQQWGNGRSLQEKVAAGILVGALGVLEAHYERLAQGRMSARVRR